MQWEIICKSYSYRCVIKSETYQASFFVKELVLPYHNNSECGHAVLQTESGDWCGTADRTTAMMYGNAAEPEATGQQPSPPPPPESRLRRRRGSSCSLAPLDIDAARRHSIDLGQECINLFLASSDNDVADSEHGDHGPSIREVQEEGQTLFADFLKEQIASEGLQEPPVLTPLSSSLNQYKNPLWAKAGRELREMADEFSRTHKRRQIQHRAQSIDISNVTQEKFRQLLAELFPRAYITAERIMTLFIFCSDIAIRALRQNVSLFKNFLYWTLEFISESVCNWVRDHGGWAAVLSKTVQHVRTALMLATIAISVYCIYRWIR